MLSANFGNAVKPSA